VSAREQSRRTVDRPSPEPEETRMFNDPLDQEAAGPRPRFFDRGRRGRLDPADRHPFEQHFAALERLRGPYGFQGFRRGPVRRGDVRSAILALLVEGPMHGYQVMQQLAERSAGLWQPSAGSIYPTLQQLEDEELVQANEQDGRRVFSLTAAGHTAAAERATRGPAPWELAGDDESVDLRRLLFGLIAAMKQVRAVGSPEDITAAASILTEARRALYRLLADEPRNDTGSGPATSA
jgi:DNA-binding PadR family transcriptional regulator